MRTRLALSSALALLLGACSTAPAYHAPETTVPAQFQEVAGWTPATPADEAARGDWWAVYQDPDLDALEQQAKAASPTLAAALARYQQARAAARETSADLYPVIGVAGQTGRARLSANRPLTSGHASTYDNTILGGAISYEPDLWGRVRNAVAADKAQAAASQADLANAQLSLQASVADAYFRLRGLDAEGALLARSVDAYARAADLTQRRHRGGIASGIDVNRAATVLGNARALVAAIASERAATEHELAALTGTLASTFTMAPRAATMIGPRPPVGTPSQLLERRPDIAAAERRVYAANREIGVARAAWFPSLTLGAGGGWQTTGPALLSTPSTFWALGPLALAQTLFDGGKRTAQVRISRAQYDEAVADYRGTVLTAFRQVEDSIAAIRQLGEEAGAQQDAAEAAERTSTIALARYRDGAASYLEVVTAQTDALTAQRTLIAVQTDRMQASVALIKAMGGPA